MSFHKGLDSAEPGIDLIGPMRSANRSRESFGHILAAQESSAKLKTLSVVTHSASRTSRSLVKTEAL